VSGLFPDDGGNPPPPQRPTTQVRPQRRRALLVTGGIMLFFFFMLSAFTGIWTDRLWFRSIGYGEVFTVTILTKTSLFVVFGLVFAAVVLANVWLAYRHRPVFRPRAAEMNVEQYREAIYPIRRLLMAVLGVLLLAVAGGSASGQWRAFLLWWNRQSFDRADPYFGRDIGWFVFSLPWWHYVVDFLMMAFVMGLIAAILTHYLYGGIRLQSPLGQRVSPAAQVQFSVLLGLFVLAKAADYWLDRFDLSTDQGRRFTGVNYTAFNAVLPAKNILMFIALICAVLFFANIVRRTWMLPTVGLGLLVLSAVLLGAVWPGLMWQFQVKPSEPDKEESFLAKNISATREAFGVEESEVQAYDATVNVTSDQLQASAESLPGIRLIDPARMNQAFNQLQQVRGYYSVAPVLDVDRYDIGGEIRDVVLGVRELDQAGLNADQRNWANEHTVYTHGFGIIAAYGNNRTADNQAPPVGEPPWAEENLPPQGDLSNLSEDGYEGRIYFGEKSPTYSIVGKPEGGSDVELDIPEEIASDEGNTTYSGEDGVAVGNIFNKVLYALKFGETNILLSNRVNENSKILYVREPRERVQKVAPWLTVDGDPYPAVVDGRVKWILDGYTTTDRYPNSERDSFEEMISDALTPTTMYATLPTDQINYMRNSVKVTVDAYDGTVELFEWEQDPILDAWRAVFPDVVKERDEMSEELLDHLRYPEDMFKVQRSILASYHVTQAQDFYKGTDLWKVPEDAADTTSKQPPYRLSVQLPERGKKSLTESEGEEGNAEEEAEAAPPSPVFSLTSVYTPNNRENLASFIAVNSDATDPDYGEIRILRLPDDSAVQGPSQIANTFAADERIQTELLPIRNNSQVRYGNLLTLPVGGGLLYVQPVYALREAGEGTYPVLRFVLASFGKEAGYGTNLTEALEDVLRNAGNEGTVDVPGEERGDQQRPPQQQEPTGPGGADGEVLDLLERADEAFAQAEAALRRGDTVAWARNTQRAQSLVSQALELAQETSQPAADEEGAAE
jgi:uncharacterized protein